MPMSEGSPPRTSIVIPVWDDYVGAALDEALRSVCSQDVDVPARIIVVDNASETPVDARHQAVVIRSPRRLTLGAARNLGLQEVRTPYVVVWDADDVMLPGTLALLEREIEAHPAFAAYATAIIEASGSRHRWPRRWVASLMRLPAAFALLHCIWSLLPTTGSTIMRAELLRSGGGYSDADSGDDWVAGVSLVFRGRIGWSEHPGRLYRLHDQSIWPRHMDVRHQRRHARDVRARIRSDLAIPMGVRATLPVIWLGQHLAILGHVLTAAVRERRRTA